MKVCREIPLCQRSRVPRAAFTRHIHVPLGTDRWAGLPRRSRHLAGRPFFFLPPDGLGGKSFHCFSAIVAAVVTGGKCLIVHVA